MTDRPITFRAEIVRALLDGRKSQTRRLLKPQPDQDSDPSGNREWGAKNRYGYWIPATGIRPYAPGDRLWVREAFITGFDIDDEFGRPVGDRKAWYRATDRGLTWYDPDTETTLDNPPWKSSIHMPRWASRLTLIVTDVRVQRVQSITEEDARAEGVCETAFWERAEHKVSAGAPWSVDRLAFADLWNSLHGPGAWDANPWVAALTFTTHHQNIDQMEPTND